jgi:hypothetical protein
MHRAGVAASSGVHNADHLQPACMPRRRQNKAPYYYSTQYCVSSLSACMHEESSRDKSPCLTCCKPDKRPHPALSLPAPSIARQQPSFLILSHARAFAPPSETSDSRCAYAICYRQACYPFIAGVKHGRLIANQRPQSAKTEDGESPWLVEVETRPIVHRLHCII